MNPPLVHHTAEIDWIPLRGGLSFKPIVFFPDDRGYQLLLRVEPGTVVPRHRHTGEVHAFVLSGTRRIVGIDDDIGPGTYVHEPVGNIDSWSALGDEPCIIHLEVNGRIEYIDEGGELLHYTDAGTARAAYLDWCRERGGNPHPALTAAAPA